MSDITKISETTGIDYDINHNNLLFDNIPIAIRIFIYDTIMKPRYFKYLQVVFDSLKTMWLSFLNYRYDTIQETRITGQTIVLEKWLQIFFNNSDIHIVSATATFNLNFLYRKSEHLDESYIARESGDITVDPQLYLFTKDESVLQFDFTVEVPLALINTGITIDQIKSQVDKYKYLGTLYNVVVI